jgi:hypothetical protein
MERTTEERTTKERTTGFEPATLTLAKETHLVRRDCCAPLSSFSPISSSAHSVESARVPRFTFNALNVCEIDIARTPVGLVTTHRPMELTYV